MTASNAVHARGRLKSTYESLVAAVRTLLGQRVPTALEEAPPVPFWASVAAAEPGSPPIERIDCLTPYAVETLADDLQWAGSGARLEIRIPTGTTDDRLAGLEARLARLSDRGIRVCILRDDRFGTGAQ